jgi:hypothetical protein
MRDGGFIPPLPATTADTTNTGVMVNALATDDGLRLHILPDLTSKLFETEGDLKKCQDSLEDALREVETTNNLLGIRDEEVKTARATVSDLQTEVTRWKQDCMRLQDTKEMGMRAQIKFLKSVCEVLSLGDDASEAERCDGDPSAVKGIQDKIMFTIKDAFLRLSSVSAENEHLMKELESVHGGSVGGFMSPRTLVKELNGGVSISGSPMTPGTPRKMIPTSSSATPVSSFILETPKSGDGKGSGIEELLEQLNQKSTRISHLETLIEELLRSAARDQGIAESTAPPNITSIGEGFVADIKMKEIDGLRTQIEDLRSHIAAITTKAASETSEQRIEIATLKGELKMNQDAVSIMLCSRLYFVLA